MIGRSVRRTEDPRFITGRGRYAGDLRIDGLASMVVVRSPLASARIIGIDLTAARNAPGVVAVWSAADLDGWNAEFPVFQLRPHPGLDRAVNHCALAQAKVRYVGEPLAVVIAESAPLALDAAHLV
jgi:carbon-monoxide dehydrogenase large subunit